MTDDRFRSYRDLSAVYAQGQHFDVSVRVGVTNPSVLVMAPHGGKIEIRTAEIADSVAAIDYSCYKFEAKLPANNRVEMHIASQLYDVPEALKAVEVADLVIALHGRRDDEDPTMTWMGGLDRNLLKHLGDALHKSGFPVRYNPPKFKGTDPNNICNRGPRKAGAQLEIPLSLRNAFLQDPSQERAFVSCLRAAIASYHIPKH